MTINEIRNLLRDNRHLMNECGVESILVFGSVARSEATSESDVDFIVDFVSEPTFLGFMRLKAHLEKILGASVDLVTRDAIKPAVKAQIEAEAVKVA